jgi:hypothetical protein
MAIEISTKYRYKLPLALCAVSVTLRYLPFANYFGVTCHLEVSHGFFVQAKRGKW